MLERHGIKSIRQYFIAFMPPLPCTQRSFCQIFAINLYNVRTHKCDQHIFIVVLKFYDNELRRIFQITPLLQSFKVKVTISNCRFSKLIKISIVLFFSHIAVFNKHNLDSRFSKSFTYRFLTSMPFYIRSCTA